MEEHGAKAFREGNKRGEREREREREARVWSTERRREDRGIIAEGPLRVALAKKS